MLGEVPKKIVMIDGEAACFAVRYASGLLLVILRA